MRRRDFFKVIACSAVASPFAAGAQQGEQHTADRYLAASKPRTIRKVRPAWPGFLQEMQLLGWSVNRNLQIDTRWGAGDAGRYRKYAAD